VGTALDDLVQHLAELLQAVLHELHVAQVLAGHDQRVLTVDGAGPRGPFHPAAHALAGLRV
jgi:hypothetical protein